MPINKFRIAFVLTKFPSQSEVPILNQIVGVVKQGHRVEIFADISEENVLHDDIAKYGLLDKVSYFKQRPIHNSKNKTLNKLSLILKTLPLIIRAFIKRPTITLRALNYRKYGSYAKSFWLFYNSYTFIFLSREYDILHAQFGPNGEKIALLKDIGLIKAKLLTSFRGYDINVIPKSDSIFKDYTYLKKWGDEFTVNTNFTKQKLIKEGFVKNNIHIIHSAIQFKNFNPTVKQNSDNSIKLISIGRLVDCKGIEFALKAIPLIQERLHKFEIIYRIIGDGVLKEELQTLCYSLNIESLVEFKGWQSQDNTIDANNIFNIIWSNNKTGLFINQAFWYASNICTYYR